MADKAINVEKLMEDLVYLFKNAKERPPSQDIIGWLRGFTTDDSDKYTEVGHIMTRLIALSNDNVLEDLKLKIEATKVSTHKESSELEGNENEDEKEINEDNDLKPAGVSDTTSITQSDDGLDFEKFTTDFSQMASISETETFLSTTAATPVQQPHNNPWVPIYNRSAAAAAPRVLQPHASRNGTVYSEVQQQPQNIPIYNHCDASRNGTNYRASENDTNLDTILQNDNWTYLGTRVFDSDSELAASLNAALCESKCGNSFEQHSRSWALLSGQRVYQYCNFKCNCAKEPVLRVLRRKARDRGHFWMQAKKKGDVHEGGVKVDLKHDD